MDQGNQKVAQNTSATEISVILEMGKSQYHFQLDL